jgi:hypothetical protein
VSYKIRGGKAVPQMITIDVLGMRKRVPFSGTAEEYQRLVDGQRYRTAEKRRLLKQAQSATGVEKVAVIREYMLLLGSHERIAAMMPLIEHEPAEVFWPVFLDCWSDCDNTWEWNEQLVETLHRVGPCNCYREQAEDGGAFFDSLPEQITVYRGGSRARIDGAISWTTSIDIAEGFARGHRFIRVPDPVVATGTINKSAVFLATNDRNESEVLCLPRIIKIEAVE